MAVKAFSDRPQTHSQCQKAAIKSTHFSLPSARDGLINRRFASGKAVSSTEFAEFHEEFLSLVDTARERWFVHHFHSVMGLAKKHPGLVRKGYAEVAEDLDKKFDRV